LGHGIPFNAINLYLGAVSSVVIIVYGKLCLTQFHINYKYVKNSLYCFYNIKYV
jgi:hypothetical protein